MLKTMRENLKSLHWVLWLVVLSFIVSIFFWDTGTRWIGGAGGNWVASVGGEQIPAREFIDELRSRIEWNKRMFGDNWDPRFIAQGGFGNQVVTDLVGRRIAMKEGERLGLSATPPEIFEQISQMEGFRDEDGNFIGVQRYAEILRRNGRSVEEFEEAIAESITLQKYARFYRDSIYISDAEVEHEFALRNRKASIRFVRMNPGDMIPEEEPAGEALAAYYEAHAEDFRAPATRRVSYLTFGEEDAFEALAEEDAMRAYYEENQERFTIPAEQRRFSEIRILVPPDLPGEERAAKENLAHEIAHRAQSGESFEDLARRYSDDLASARRGGDQGHVSKGELMPAIDSMIFASGMGEVRGPVDSPIGFHIIKVTEEELGGHVHPFEELRDEIATTLYASESIAWLDERAAAVQEALDNGATLEEAAEQVGFPMAETVVEEGRGIQGLGDFPAVQDAVLAEPGTVSGAVNVFRGIAFIRVEEAIEAAPLPLEEVRDRVVRLVKAEQAEQAAREAADGIHAALSTGTPLSEAAEAKGLEVEEAGPFAMRGSVGSLGQAHKLRHDVFETDEGAIGPVTEVDGAYVVYEVTERIEPDPFAIEEEREQIRESLRGAMFNELYPAALDRLQDRYEVRVNQELVDYVTQSLAQPRQPMDTPDGEEPPAEG